MNPPAPVSGGCLCGAIRYSLSFAGPSAWPPKTHTCQCTQCRKRHGALVVPWLSTPSTLLSFFSPTTPTTKTSSPSDLPSFAEYSASPGRYRGFCTKCGSPLTFRADECPGEIQIATGSLDGEVWGGEAGGVLGRASEGHFWCERVVEGVTDLEGGRRWKGGEGSEEMGG